jgi:hypothetical protein
VSLCRQYFTCSSLVLGSVCIGTGRGVSSKTMACRLWSLTPLKFSTLEDARRTRVLLTAMIFDLTESGLRLEMSEDHNKFEKFCDESAEKLWRFDGIQRVITSVHGNSNHSMLYRHSYLLSGGRLRGLLCSHSYRQILLLSVDISYSHTTPYQDAHPPICRGVCRKPDVHIQDK